MVATNLQEEIIRLKAEIDRLTAERDEALEILTPGKLYDLFTGQEVPTTLVERAKWTVAALDSEADMADARNPEALALCAAGAAEQRAADAALLREIEWDGCADCARCPSCHGWDDLRCLFCGQCQVCGHTQDCRLATRLR